MNSKYSTNGAPTGSLRALWAMLCLLAVLWVTPAQAQINYTQDFTGCAATVEPISCNGWSVTGGWAPGISATDPGDDEGYSPCTAANPAVKANLWTSAPVGTIVSVASLGTSNGTLATFTFNYKAVDYSTALPLGGPPTPAGEAQFVVSYSETGNTGPWTPIGSPFTNALSASCIASPSFTFTPTNGAPVFIQIVVTNLLPDFDGFWAVLDDFSLTQAAGSNCNATPVPGNTLSSNGSVCPGANFTLSLQNATSGDGVSYAWERNTGLGWNGFGTNSPTQVVTQTQATDYRCTVTCPFSTPTDGTSTPVSVGMNAPSACYCNTVTFNFNVEPISLVQFANINNPSSCAVGLPPINPFIEDFTSITGNINAGQTYAMTLSGNTDGAFTTFFTAFFDFDQNGTFETSFPIGSINNTACVATVSNNIIIPVLAPAGISRMRIIKNYFVSPTDPCGTYDFGQAEDYLVNVTAAAVCNSDPAPGNTLASVGAACSAVNFTLSLQNPPSGLLISYQWESADDDAFTSNVQSLGTSATQVTSQTSAKYYRCLVTCGNTSESEYSGVLLVPMASACVCSTYCAATNTGGSCITNVSLNTLNNTTVGCSPTFYSLEAATTTVAQGVSYNFSMTSEAGTIASVWFDWNQDLSFTPDEWYQVYTAGAGGSVSISVPVTASLGGTRMRVRTRFTGNPNGAADACSFMGSGETEDYCITVDPAPSCLPPSGLAGALASSVSSNVTWNVVSGATGYQVEVRQGGAPGSGGEVFAGSTTATNILATGLTLGQTYQLYVRTDCDVDGFSLWTGPVNYLHDYCAAGADNGNPANDAQLLNVTGAGINAGSPSGTQIPYVNLTANVGNMAPGGTYPFSFTRNVNYNNSEFRVWIDWNDDVDFNDPGEALPVSPFPVANPYLTNLVCPPGTTPGNKRMRVRWQYVDGVNGFLANNTPCGNSTFGQVVDFTINVCAPMVATTLPPVDNCGTGTFSIGVNVSDLGTGPNPRIAYSVNGGGTQYLNAPSVGAYVLDNGGPGFLQTDVVLVSLDNGSVCTSTIGNHYGSCPITINCPNVYNLPAAHCYRAVDPRTWEFVSDDALQTVRITFSQGCLDAGDNIIFRDGPGGSQIDQIIGPADLTGYVATSSGTVLFVEIVSDATGNCFDGTCTTPWLFSVQCTPDCENPTAATGSVVQNCGTSTYQVPVTINSTEDGNPVDVQWLINGTPSGTTPVGVGSTVNIPPAGVPFGSTLNLNVLHAVNPLCNLTNVGGTFNPTSTCPPANDECAGATVLPLLGSGVCPGGGTVSSTLNATYSLPAALGTCGVGPATQDVWFTFNTGTNTSPLYIYITPLTATGIRYQLYSGTCGALVSVGACFTAPPLTFSGFPTNTNYYLRVFTNSSVGVPGTFRVCLQSSPTCGGLGAAPAPSITNNSPYAAQYNFTGVVGNYIVEYGPSTGWSPGLGATANPPGQIVTTSIPTGTAGIAQLACLTPSTGYRVFVRRDCGGGNYGMNFSAVGTAFTTLAAAPAAPVISNGVCGVGAAILDNGCGTPANTTNRTIPIAGVPGTQLGVDIALSSVELVIAHAWRTDLMVRLESPDGCTRTLIARRGGGTANFGNPATCPTGALRLQDGAPALSTMAGINAAGPHAPENALSSFTGNPNGNWIIRVCDAAAIDAGTLQYVRLNFVTCLSPTVSAPVIQPNCANNTFSVAFNVTGVGNSPDGLVSINNTGGAPALNNQGVGAKVVGPFPYGSPVSITVVHTGDPACNVNIGPLNPANACLTNGTCGAPLPIAIPDGNPAGTNVFITLSGLPTTMGSSPTNAFFESVDMKVTHTWRGDVRATLTSPGGQTFTLINQRQNANDSGNNLGDGAQACPNGVIKFKDGATSMAPGWTANVDNTAVGTWAPEQPLSGFTGNPNGTWTLNIADLVGIDTGTLTYFRMNFQTVDCLGIPGGATVPGTPCFADTPANSTLGVYDANCVCTSQLCTTDLRIDFTMDAASSMNWELRQDGTNALVQTGTSQLFATEETVNTCLPNGNYYMVVTDAQGDGITGGGYVLRTATGTLPYTRVIDNRGNYAGVTPSQVSGPPVSANAFTIPMSSDRLIFTSCDKLDWRLSCNSEYVVATDNPAVTAQYNVTPATSGYEMWWYNPNGGYSFRRTQYHNTPNGLAASSTRACHFKPNSWSGNALAQNVLYNVKVRAIVAGSPGAWGPACRFMISDASAACPRTKLMDIPDNQFLSCGQERLANNTGIRVHARNVRRVNGSCAWVNANRYQFRFRIVGDGINVVKTSATNQYFVNTVGLLCGKTYLVDVRASFDNGATWCVPGGTGINDPAWGDVCTLTTLPCAPAQGGNQNMAVEGSDLAGLKMYPNPNRGDQLLLSLEGIEQGVTTVSVDIYDAFGKRAIARILPVSDDGFINTLLELNGSLAAGLYTVSITAGERQFNERLVIQP